MGRVAASDALELLLCAPVFRRNMASAGAGLAGVVQIAHGRTADGRLVGESVRQVLAA